jgi:hypothetical protein
MKDINERAKKLKLDEMPKEKKEALEKKYGSPRSMGKTACSEYNCFVGGGSAFFRIAPIGV